MDFKSNARVFKDDDLWYGEYYGTFVSLFHSESTKWVVVTEGHLTRLGAMLALKLWIRNNIYTYI